MKDKIKLLNEVLGHIDYVSVTANTDKEKFIVNFLKSEVKEMIKDIENNYKNWTNR